MRRWRSRFARLAMLVLAAGASEASAGTVEERIAAYAYEDTRRLVELVERAAALVATEGEAALTQFAVPDSEWFDGSIYFFAYALDGTCLFNAEAPDLVGRNLLDLEDLNGKPLIRYITDIGRESPPDAFGWVFYLWQEGTQLSPSWKSAYVRKVVTPDGKTLVIGSGLYDIKIERSFVEQRIANAVDLLHSKGTDAAFDAFRDPSSSFNFLDTYVFVLDEKGTTLVDPAFPGLTGRDMRDFRDAVGTRPIVHLIEKLESSDDAWVQYLWPRPGEALPSRKLIHAHKVTVDGKTYIVGSDYFLATPIWMRVEEVRPWRNALPA